MRAISRIDFEENRFIIHYHDNADPKWVEEQVLAVNCDWKKSAHVVRLAHVGYHCFHVLIEHPDGVEKHDEVLQEWLGRLFAEHLADGHERP